MVPEAPLEKTELGVVPKGDGWFVMNARDAEWRHAEGRGAVCDFEGDTEFAQLGIHLSVLEPGQPLAMYHWEADQEDFLVLSGEAVLIVEGEERPLRAWDFVHCPPETKHTIVGAGDGPGVIVMAGSRAGGFEVVYPVNEVAARHGASVLEEKSSPEEAHAHFGPGAWSAYREGWLPSISAPG